MQNNKDKEDELLSLLPLNKERIEIIEKLKKTPNFKLAILIELTNILNKEVKTQEEAAAQFYKAQPLSKLFTN